MAFRIGLRGKRWFVQAVAVLLLLFVVINWVVGPAIQAGIATNAPRSASPTASALGVPGAIDVTFPARDGIRLVGWYVPGQNRAAVILLHGSHITRDSAVPGLVDTVAIPGTVVLEIEIAEGVNTGEVIENMRSPAGIERQGSVRVYIAGGRI